MFSWPRSVAEIASRVISVGDFCRNINHRSRAHSLIPLHNVQAFHEEPKARAELSDEGREQNGRDQLLLEGRKKDLSKAVNEVAQARDALQNPEKLGEVPRAKHQICSHKTTNPKKDEPDSKAVFMQRQQKLRQGLKLIWIKRLQIIRASKKKQHRDQIQFVCAQNGGLEHAEQCREQREVFADRLQQYIKNYCHRDVGDVHD